MGSGTDVAFHAVPPVPHQRQPVTRRTACCLPARDQPETDASAQG